MDGSIIRSVKLTAILIVSASTSLALFHRTPWAIGLLLGSAWSIANLLSIVGILKIATLQKPDKKLALILFLKFPVLYIIGFIILVSRLFPVSSLLTGLFSVVIIIGMSKLWPIRT